MKNVRWESALTAAGVLVALSLLVGLLGGGVGALFGWVLVSVAKARAAAPWLMLLLPVGGLLTVVLYRAFRMGDYGGANKIVRCLSQDQPIRAMAAPLRRAASSGKRINVTPVNQDWKEEPTI